MSAGDRIKGQEVSVSITQGGDLVAEITEIKDAEFTYQFEIKTQGYLGEKTNRKDTVYNGVAGKLTFHVHDGSVFDVIQGIKDKAQRRSPDLSFNVSGIFQFPSGEVRTIEIPDVAFGAVPISANDRGDYVSSTFEFEADDAEVIKE